MGSVDYSKDTKKFWRREIKHRGVQFLGGICRNCGNVFDDCCYDFHHLNPNEKDFNISSAQTNGAKTWLKVRDELKKCVLLCANCHRLIHNKLINKEIEPYFNDEYYEWDLMQFKLVDTQTGIPKYANIICPTCGEYKSPSAQQCHQCSKLTERRFEVSRDELKEMIYNETFEDIGRKFGVSGNAIRNRCKMFGLPYKRQDIMVYSKEDWELI